MIFVELFFISIVLAGFILDCIIKDVDSHEDFSDEESDYEMM